MNTLNLLQVYLKDNGIKTRDNKVFTSHALYHKATNGNNFNIQLNNDMLVVQAWAHQMLGHTILRCELSHPNAFDTILNILKRANQYGTQLTQ